MSSSFLITMQPVACVFSSCPSLRPSALRGSMVSRPQTLKTHSLVEMYFPKVLAVCFNPVFIPITGRLS